MRYSKQERKDWGRHVAKGAFAYYSDQALHSSASYQGRLDFATALHIAECALRAVDEYGILSDEVPVAQWIEH
jgi:hypothetical protein